LNLASLQTLTQSNTRLLEIGIVGHESKLSKTHISPQILYWSVKTCEWLILSPVSPTKVL
jgi:hypothetical protein